LAEGYELKLCECASCSSDLWLVSRVSDYRRTSSRRKISSGLPVEAIDAALRRAGRAAARKLKRPPAEPAG
jgi:hypothetical protein